MKIDSSQIPAPHLQNKVSPEEDKQIRQVAKQFESLFVNQVVSQMRKTVIKQGLVPEGPGERIYQSMLDSEHAGAIAESEQIGLSKLVYDQLLRSRGLR